MEGGDYLSNVNTVYLLGAGASKHLKLNDTDHCAPADADFFEKAFSLDKWCEDPYLRDVGKNALELIIKTLESAGIKKDGLVNANDPRGVTMEEAFCRAELLKMLGRHARNEDLKEPKQWNYAADALRDLATVVLSQAKLPIGRDEGGYMGFTRKVLTKHGNRCAVLTLNYEIGLETAVWKAWKDGYEKTRACLKDGMPGCADLYWYDLPNRNEPKSEFGESIPILKLHGSCNWGFCPECNNVEFLIDKTDDPFIHRLVGAKRQRCHWHARDPEFAPYYEPHIVPPTWNKWMGDFTMRHIWRQAYNVLSKADRLFIIGTSLPKTDVHLRHLLRAAVHSGDDRKIYVVNTDECIRKRVEAVFGVPDDLTDPNSKESDFGSQECINWIAGRSGLNGT